MPPGKSRQSAVSIVRNSGRHRILSGAVRAGTDPGFRCVEEISIGHRRSAAWPSRPVRPRRPCPGDQRRPQMIDDGITAAIAVVAPVDQPAAQIGGRQPVPAHRERRQAPPIPGPWYAACGIVDGTMTGRARHAWYPHVGTAAHDVEHMPMTINSLPRVINRSVAVLTARAEGNSGDRRESGKRLPMPRVIGERWLRQQQRKPQRQQGRSRQKAEPMTWKPAHRASEAAR